MVVVAPATGKKETRQELQGLQNRIAPHIGYALR